MSTSLVARENRRGTARSRVITFAICGDVYAVVARDRPAGAVSWSGGGAGPRLSPLGSRPSSGAARGKRGASPGCGSARVWISPRTQRVFKETPSSEPPAGSGGAGEALQELAGSRFCEPVLPILSCVFFFPFVPKSRGVVPAWGRWRSPVGPGCLLHSLRPTAGCAGRRLGFQRPRRPRVTSAQAAACDRVARVWGLASSKQCVPGFQHARPSSLRCLRNPGHGAADAGRDQNGDTVRAEAALKAEVLRL